LKRYFAASALLPHGWRTGVAIDVDDAGTIAAVTEGADGAGAERIAGHALAGMPNVHSHAFQRAFAGSAERGSGRSDSFWTWRETMYAFVARIQPDHAEAIAAYLYAEMLKAGYTSVGEFHYLHHAADGTRLGRPTEMAERIRSAARAAGIGLTLLPVLYEYGGFDARTPQERQHRFLMTPDEYVAYWDELATTMTGAGQERLGVAPHSLRAVAPEHMREVLEYVAARDASAPVHIHIAEQQAEVDDCLAWSGARPIEWLFAHAPVTPQWCLVHATHADDGELRLMADARVVAGLCPTTEANLGDGLFEAETFLAAGGAIGIGSDSHASVDVAEELRWLEYGRRLALERRAVLAGEGEPSVGGRLYRAALAGGRQAVGRAVGRIEAGARADLVVVDADHPDLAGVAGDEVLDRFVFAGARSAIRDVMAGGRWVVREGRHADEEAITQRYRTTLRALRS
jgi:formimidoylglutamate deiminase